MSKIKYVFEVEPPKGEFGEWRMPDGWKCYTDKRSTAVSWYKRYLENKR